MEAESSEANLEGVRAVKIPVEGEEAGPDEMKSLRIEIEALKSALAEEQQTSKTKHSQLLYLQADFDNYRKSLETQINERISVNKSVLFLRLIGFKEDLERALEVGRETNERDSWLNGIEMVRLEMEEFLRREGVAPIEAVRKPFDPSLHEAVGYVETDDHLAGTVVREVRRGYTLNGRVIRPSMVELAQRAVGDIKLEDS